MNTYFRIDNPADVRIIDDATITAWESTSNPKLLLWAQQPPAPSLTAQWVDGSWTEPVPTVIPLWVDFSAVIMALPSVNLMLGAVLQNAPGLYGGLVVGLQNASEGDTRVFLNSWNAAYAMELISPELITTVQEIAEEYDLPEAFIEALEPTIDT
jgi:hypothetical protein